MNHREHKSTINIVKILKGSNNLSNKTKFFLQGNDRSKNEKKCDVAFREQCTSNVNKIKSGPDNEIKTVYSVIENIN